MADWFGFIIEVPTWDAMDRETRERLAAGGSEMVDADLQADHWTWTVGSLLTGADPSQAHLQEMLLWCRPY